MKLRNLVMKIWPIVLLLMISGCYTPLNLYSNECSWCEPILLRCNKEALSKEGLKCSQVISRETQEQVELTNQMCNRCSSN